MVISTGVLHHTKDARAAFASIVRKAKPGGLIVVGLYNGLHGCRLGCARR